MINRKGFTLIELLAVIVILGLLLAVAIPGVSKYIETSRKKTLASTIENYTGSLITEVNNLQYNFYENNTIFAVPIECIDVERGGENPFGEWKPANNDYWAYVLVQYDVETHSYIYGFTFKDSAGYGLYPTSINNLNDSTNQIQVNLDLKVAASGGYEIWTDVENWVNSGFKLNDETVVKVLEQTNNGVCKPKKACNVVSGSGTDVGDIISCGGEEFYVISSNGNSVTMFAKYRLDFQLNRQNENSKTSTYFSTIGSYWIENDVLKSEYGEQYPVYVFDSNSNFYNNVEKYNKYLRDEVHVSSAKSSLISLEQLIDLGCNMENRYCTDAPDWVNSTYYWTGTVNGNGVWGAYGGRLFSFSPGVAHGIRTILTVTNDEINFNNN